MKKKRKLNLYGFDGQTSVGSKRMRYKLESEDDFYNYDGADGALKFWVSLITVVLIISFFGVYFSS